MPKMATNPLSFLTYKLWTKFEEWIWIKSSVPLGPGRNNFNEDEALINGSRLPISDSFPIPILQCYAHLVQHETPQNMDAERRRCQVPITKYQGKKNQSGNKLSNSERKKKPQLILLL